MNHDWRAGSGMDSQLVEDYFLFSTRHFSLAFIDGSIKMTQQDTMVAAIVQEVLQRLPPHLQGGLVAPVRMENGKDGVFSNVNEAVQTAAKAQEKLATMTLDEREG